MNSQFPMSFGPEDANNNAKKAKSNVVPLSRPQDSMLAVSSAAKNSRAQSRFDYAVSQFADATDGFRNSRVGPGRWLLRGFLITVLGSLWLAIGTGRLSSDSPDVEKIREMMSMSSTASEGDSHSEAAQNSAVSDSNRTEPSANQAAMTTVQTPMPQLVEPEKAQGGTATSNASADRSETSSATAPAAANAANVTLASNTVAPVPVAENVVADDDLLKAVKILARQQAQLNEMEGHLGMLLTNTEDPKQAAKQLADLEARHMEAVAKLKQLRSKIRQ
jgi:hypothetical protein